MMESPYGSLRPDQDFTRKCPECGHTTRVHNNHFTRHCNPELLVSEACPGSGQPL